jgi:endonuclease/exonuclease/phosphatase family metal-dependent hydrolase
MPTLRLVTYNVRYFAHALKGLASTPRSMSGIAKALATLEPLADVICLQEVETHSIRANLTRRRAHEHETQLEQFMHFMTAAFAEQKQECPYEALYFPAHTYGSKTGTRIYTTGLAVLARRGLLVERHNAEAPHDITHRGIRASSSAKQTRICAHLRIGGEHGIHIFNTHMSLPTPFERNFWNRLVKGEERMGHGPNQLLEVDKLIAFVREQSAGEPFVVVGDFNTSPGSPVYQRLVEAGLVDAQASVTQQPLEVLRGWPTAGFMKLRMHLDHVFGGNGVTWLDVEGSHPFGDGGRFDGLSDHVPLVARLRIRD